MAHEHSVFDQDPHFVIDENTRLIKIASGTLPTIVQHDHNSERLTFELPKVIDGHDMALCDLVRINYIVVDASTRETSDGAYKVKDLTVVDGDEEKLAFSWLISCNATKYAGKLSFSISFICTGEEDNVDYRWSTLTNSDLNVGKGIDNGDEIAEEYADILTEWEQRIEDFEASGGASDEQIETAVTKYLDENPVEAGSTATIGLVDLIADKWVSNGNSENLHSQEVTIYGVPENFNFKKCQVDLTPSVEQLLVFYEKDLTFVTENEDGNVTVYAIGQRPTNDYTVQVTITEVSV